MRPRLLLLPTGPMFPRHVAALTAPCSPPGDTENSLSFLEMWVEYTRDTDVWVDFENACDAFTGALIDRC